MHIVVSETINVLALAAQFSGVPGLAGAAFALTALANSCEQLKVQKELARQLSRRCAGFLVLLQDNQHKLEGTDLQAAADELELHVSQPLQERALTNPSILESIAKRVQKWASYSATKAYWKQNSVKEGLDRCCEEIATHEAAFQMKCHMEIRAAVRDEAQIRGRDNAELKELVLQLLHNRQHMRDLQVMEQEGIPIAERLMEEAQEELYHHPRDSQKYLEYQRGLLNLHQATGVPPAMPDLSREVTRLGNSPVIGGTYSDVWLGNWLGQKKVALKGLRNVRVSNSAVKRFNQEIRVWSRLKHDNILPLLGFVSNLGPHIHTVSPWQENGNAVEFVKANPGFNRLGLLAGAARGLEYLHGLEIVHGNVKCSNILVTEEATPVVCDFGLSTVIGDITETTASATLTTQGSARWLAPELIEGVISTPSYHSDVYSFSMAVLELITLQPPFAHRRRDAAVIKDVVLYKAHPPKPVDCAFLSEELWGLMERSWNANPLERPPLSYVAQTMSSQSSRVPTSQPCTSTATLLHQTRRIDEDVEMG